MIGDFTGASFLIFKIKEMKTVTNYPAQPPLLKDLSLHHWHFFMVTATWEGFFCHVSSKRRAGRQRLRVFRADKEPLRLCEVGSRSCLESFWKWLIGLQITKGTTEQPWFLMNLQSFVSSYWLFRPAHLSWCLRMSCEWAVADRNEKVLGHKEHCATPVPIWVF